MVDGSVALHAAGGPVTRNILGPKWLVPPLVFVSSPQGAHDVLGRQDGIVDRGGLPTAGEIRKLMGGNLLVLKHADWLPRRRILQPMFTKQRVPAYAGHMAAAAEDVAQGFKPGALIDLDTECRSLTLRALGRSILGMNLDEHSESIGPALRDALGWATDRGVRPVNAPRWLPTPGQRRARAANRALRRTAHYILGACRADPDLDAPLVRALLTATDPVTGHSLDDDEICNELVLFMLAGHDTTSTTLAYALWQLGRAPELQDQVAAEAAAVGQRPLTPDDVPELRHTVRVLHEALRLCPPAATIGRLVNQDIEVDGHLVTAGSVAVVSIYAMHRDPALWANPDTFDPGRFSPERSQGRDRWQYLPFGGGPRSCVGDHFAMLEATLALATIVRAVRIESRAPTFPLESPFTVVAAAPITAVAHRR